jgi:hypothetical protein
VCLLGLLFLVILSAFIYEEQKRTFLINQYRASSEIVAVLRNNQSSPMDKLMNQNEVVACAMDSYGNASDLQKIEAAQRASIPKDRLPSEDMKWYLIFFDKEKATRIFLFERYGEQGITLLETNCVLRGGVYKVQKRQQNSQEIFEINFYTE